ncbi:MAG: 50S ribosomal protein L18 [bacterium]|nr:50S ribosomal protein L18 [bacterium]
MKKNIVKKLDKRLEVMVFRSNKYIYAQVIDEGKIVASYSSLNLNKKEKQKVNKTQEAKLVGIELAKNLLEKKHKKVRLNKKNYAYLGRVKAFTEGMREGGLEV